MPARHWRLSCQYVAIGAGFYKDEGIDPEIVYVASGTRQAAAVMGGSADITQVGLPHGLEAVARGGTLVAIGTAFDKYPIALVLYQRGDQAHRHHAGHVAG